MNIPSESMDYAKESDFAIYNNSSVREASERLLDIVTQNK
jgi:2-phosphoglycerate kinase